MSASVSGWPARRARVTQYGAAVVIGLLAVVQMLPWAVITGTGGLFAFPRGDLPVNLAGHLAYQWPGWHFPLLLAPALAWPHGESIAMTDSNPALSLIAKLLAGLIGHPINLFGLWLAACFVLQPAAAVYAVRGFARGGAGAAPVNMAAAACAAACLVLLLPEYLFRTFHINLLGQFILLVAAGVAARECTAPRLLRFARIFPCLMLAVLIHPYLFLFCAATLSAPVVAMILQRAPDARASARAFGVAVMLPAGIFVLLNGGPGQGGPGFGLYSLNLLSPVWPQYSGIFGADLPALDATGYQLEGFNYLGGGIILLLAAAILCLLTLARRDIRGIGKRWSGMVLVLLGLTLLAVTPHVTAGHAVLIPLQSRVLEQLFGVVRASGRAVWVVDLAAVTAALALLAARLRPAYFLPLVALVLGVQWIDTAPLRAQAKRYFAGADQSPPPFAMPAGTTLFRVVPLCGPQDVVATEYRLMALRAGSRLADIRLVHPLPDVACARALADGRTTPMAPGETRLFIPPVQPGPLGDGVRCADVAVGRLCHRP